MRRAAGQEGGGVVHVEFTGGELGVVRHVDALVPELTADLVHAINAADDELLQVELGRDAHAQVELQIVVKSFKGPCGGAASLHVHHGRLHLQEAAGVEVAPGGMELRWDCGGVSTAGRLMHLT